MPDALLTADASPTDATTPTVRPDVALALLCVAQLMLVLDFSIVNVALPAMDDDLGFRLGGLQWDISAFALTFGGAATSKLIRPPALAGVAAGHTRRRR